MTNLKTYLKERWYVWLPCLVMAAYSLYSIVDVIEWTSNKSDCPTTAIIERGGFEGRYSIHFAEDVDHSALRIAIESVEGIDYSYHQGRYLHIFVVGRMFPEKEVLEKVNKIICGLPKSDSDQ